MALTFKKEPLLSMNLREPLVRLHANVSGFLGTNALMARSPLMSEEGKRCGLVGDVCFSTEDGSVKSLFIDKGASAGALLGATGDSSWPHQGF